MQYERNDITKIEKGVICHQVSCKGVMGAGLAKQLRNKYPRHYTDYMASEMRLGNIVVTEITPELYIVGLFGQYGYGRDKVQTNYSAFRMALKTAYNFANVNGLKLYIPYKIGCGLAGGDWDTVHGILQEDAPDAIIVRYDPQ